ncbi:MAG TPA: serine/threonine-protein kinase [Solirubrobacteraceae bacterium]|nr:serine/threonine-protein kinase [Solirubrobacteraceae bacterium]
MDGTEHDPDAAPERTILDATVVDRSAVELAAGTQFAGYVVEGIAGRGGMGIVYRARQLRPARTVALKVISPALADDREFRERFARESEIAASIEHSNVIPVYQVGEESHLLYIVMRYVEGTDLRAVLAAEGRLAPARAIAILSELTAALDAAHAHGLVHRDVKPANVLIAREGQRDHVYLTDFGLAKLSAGDGRTRAGMFVGTLDYAAPEQIEGRQVDARTDVYAAGCLLYEMLTGSVPFRKDSQAAIMFAHVSADPPSARSLVPSLPPALDAVIARAMAKDPSRRHQSAGDLARDAAAAAPRRRRSWMLVGGAAALVAVVLVAVILISGSRGHGSHGTTTTASHTTTPAPTTKTYANTQLGVSFSYPASWHAFSLQGSPADFGTGSGASETRCALVIERGVGPAGASQEARFAFVRDRSATAAHDAKHYELRAIVTEQAANTTGVGLLRVADGQGGHLGFFFRGRDVYVFDCITPAAGLDQVDRQAFQPLLASVRIG